MKRGLRQNQRNQPGRFGSFAQSLSNELGDVIQQREEQGNAMWEDRLNYSCTAVVSELIVAWQENTQASCWIT